MRSDPAGGRKPPRKQERSCSLAAEVVPLGWKRQVGFPESLGARVTLFLGLHGARFWTDHGNVVEDCRFGPIADPHALARQLDARAATVGHGLFHGLTTGPFVAGPDGPPGSGSDIGPRISARTRAVPRYRIPRAGGSVAPVPYVVFAGAHLGYDAQRFPLGGGAAVGIALACRWAETQPFPLLILGSGDRPPASGVEYRPLEWGNGQRRRHPADLSIRQYARLSRRFEGGVTGFLETFARDADPTEVCVLHNDIAEAGDFARIAALGYRQAAIFHVDVVDYVAQIYLRGRLSAPTLARAVRALARARATPLLPDVVKLALVKQEACARHCDLMIVPSTRMAEILRAAYPWRTEEDVVALPWGTLAEPVPPAGEEAAIEIERRYRPEGRPMILALSRISPEKGQDLLLRALALWERRGGREVLVFICGAPAYMHGGSYLRTLRRLARALRVAEVHFPGYVAGAEKHAFFRASDLYVFPSRHESYGLTLMEALAAGLPVLTTDHRSARDLVRPEFGRVVPACAGGLYQGLADLLARPEDLPLMGEAGRRFAHERPFALAADELASRILGLLAPLRGAGKRPLKLASGVSKGPPRGPAALPALV